MAYNSKVNLLSPSALKICLWLLWIKAHSSSAQLRTNFASSKYYAKILWKHQKNYHKSKANDFLELLSFPFSNDDKFDLCCGNDKSLKMVQKITDVLSKSKTLFELRGGSFSARKNNYMNENKIPVTMSSSSSSSSFVSKIARKQKPKEYKRIQVYFKCVQIVSLWVIVGTLFYSKINNWPYHQSFFYTVDSGMSIGFCTDVHETNNRSRAFTIVHILLGASGVGGALILFVRDLMNDIEHGAGKSLFGSSYYGEYKKLLERDAFSRADKDQSGYLTYDQFRNLLEEWTIDHYQYHQNLTEQRGHTRVTKSNVLNEEIFTKLCDRFDTNGDGRINYKDFSIVGYNGLDRLLALSKKKMFWRWNGLYSKRWWMRLLNQTWDSIHSLFVGENRIYLIFSLWILTGISWGHLYQKWDIITSIHFAVSALSTGGLTAPAVNEQTGVLDVVPALFCGFYCLFGIPLFALTLGHFARVFISNYLAAANRMAIMKPLDVMEFEFAKSLCSTDNAMHISDFIVLQLLRQGKISMETMSLIKKQFDMLDVDKSGVLTLDEATQRCHMTNEYSIEGC